jgi:hypothetical protein
LVDHCEVEVFFDYEFVGKLEGDGAVGSGAIGRKGLHGEIVKYSAIVGFIL